LLATSDSRESESQLLPLVSLRDVQGADNDFLFELFSSTRIDELAVVPWSDEQKAAFLRMQFDAQTRYYSDTFPYMDYRIVLVDGHRAGRIMTTPLPGDLHVIDISILPPYRNFGIGTMLLNNLMVQAEREHMVLSLYVEAYNRARALYERLGFVEAGTDKIYSRMEYRPAGSFPGSVKAKQGTEIER
jgi:ribosomal protein S18 acetylase RimI-like enzyme